MARVIGCNIFLPYPQSVLRQRLTIASSRPRSAGVSRQFAFIGFKTADAGANAVRRMNRTFLGQARLVVEAARDIGAAVDGDARPWSRHTRNVGGASSVVDRATFNGGPTAAPGSTAPPSAKDSGAASATRKHEFMALQRMRPSGGVWANDDDTGHDANASATSVVRRGGRRGGAAHAGIANEAGANGSESDSSDEGYDELPSEARGAVAPARLKTGVPIAATADLTDMDFLRAHVRTGNFDDDTDEEERAVEKTDRMEDGTTQRRPYSSAKRRAHASNSKNDAALGSIQRNITDDDDQEPDDDGKAVAAPQHAGQSANVAAPNNDVPDVGETGRLFVRNLPYTATAAEVAAYFKAWGPLAEEPRLPRSSGGGAGDGTPRGFALVTYVLPEHAISALAGADSRIFQGRVLHVLPARPPPTPPVDVGGSATSSTNQDGKPASKFQSKREEDRRASAIKSANATGGGAPGGGGAASLLYTRSDTAVAAVAARLGIAPSALLDRDSSGMAVRAALAETAVVAETTAFLRAEGVDVDALNGRSNGAAAATATARSDTVLLVKNLPGDADAAAMRELFGRHGTLARVVLPPSRALALIEFTVPRAARAAFAALAYARFRRVPLYLEWAPEGVFLEPAPAVSTVSSSMHVEAPTPAPVALRAHNETEMTSGVAADITGGVAGAAEARTLFVKNLAFHTTEEGLRDMFSNAGSGNTFTLRSVAIPRRRNPKFVPTEAAAATTGSKRGTGLQAASLAAPPGVIAAAQTEWLSLGYGFVEFATAEEAGRALRTLQGKTLDGHILQLSVSGSGGAESTSATTSKKRARTATDGGASRADAENLPPVAAANSTKLLVRNLAFEATRKDVAELFSPFGAVRSVRLPKKFDGSHRGFAFVDFLTRAEAESAKLALAATHLYGRHLVIEWSAMERNDGAGVGTTVVGSASATAPLATGGKKKSS